MKLIGLHGKARSGKDTVADHLVENHGFVKVSFAEPIKKGICAMFDLPMSIFDDDQKDEVIDWIGKSPRQLAQTLGTEWGRELISPSLWIDVLDNKLDRLAEWKPGLKVVVPDVRFEAGGDVDQGDEAQYVREFGELWHIQRPGCAKVNAHVSEAGIKPAAGEATIVNDGTLPALYAQVDRALAQSEQPRKSVRLLDRVKRFNFELAVVLLGLGAFWAVILRQAA